MDYKIDYGASMGLKWIATNYPDVTYREHVSRTYQGKPDRYFVIRYRAIIKDKEGKFKKSRRAEPVGWWSKGMNAKKASLLRDQITENIRLGNRPQSIAEMRQMEQERLDKEAQQQALKEKQNITFDVMAKEYLSWLRSNKKAPKANESRYKNHIQPAFGNMPMRDISPLHLERFKKDLQKKQLAPKTIHHCLTMIRTVYKKAVTWGHYDGQLPTSQIEFPTVNNKRLRFFSHEEAALLLEDLVGRSKQTHDQALIALHCGLRSDEIRSMKWGHLDFKQAIIHLPDTKSGESQQVFMTDETKDMLLDSIPENPRPNDYVFPGKDDGKQFDISRTFKRCVEKLGFNRGIDPKDRQQRVVFHTLRHTFCSWLAIQGTPLYTIKELARHRSITQTERYAHLIPDQKQDAVKQMAEAFNKTKKQAAEIVDLSVSR